MKWKKFSYPLVEEYSVSRGTISSEFQLAIPEVASFLIRRKDGGLCVFRTEENRDSELIKFDTRRGRNIEKGEGGGGISSDACVVGRV